MTKKCVKFGKNNNIASKFYAFFSHFSQQKIKSIKSVFPQKGKLNEKRFKNALKKLNYEKIQ